VPGVNVIVAASFLAAIGDIGRFESPPKLVGYLGLDPRVRQSGPGPATHGHIAKQGSVRARHALVEACWTAVRQPGPLHAFYARIPARHGLSDPVTEVRALEQRIDDVRAVLDARAVPSIAGCRLPSRCAAGEGMRARFSAARPRTGAPGRHL
jgi:Transposase IS116/IS110/IS902 family